MSIGDSHRTARCAPPFLIRGEMEMYVEEIEIVGETEMVRESETELVREMRGDGDIEVKNG